VASESAYVACATAACSAFVIVALVPIQALLTFNCPTDWRPCPDIELLLSMSMLLPLLLLMLIGHAIDRN